MSNAIKLPFEFENYWVTDLIKEDSYSISYKAEDMKKSVQVVIEELFVSKIVHRGQKDSVVVHELKFGPALNLAKEGFRKDFDLAKTIEDSLIIKPLALVEKNNTLYKVLPRKKYKEISAQSTICETEKVLIPVILPLMESLRDLHKRSICHGEISLDAIGLVQSKSAFKPFSQARYLFLKLLDEERRHYDTKYFAPELKSIKNVTPQSDIFAFGVMLFTLLTGKEFSLKVCETMSLSSFMPENREFSDVFLRALQKMYQTDPELRTQGWQDLIQYCSSFSGVTKPYEKITKERSSHRTTELMTKKPSKEKSTQGFQLPVVKIALISMTIALIAAISYIFITVPSNFEVKKLSTLEALQYKIASYQGDLTAKQALAEIYLKGIGCDVDLESASELYNEIINLGNDSARIILAKHYLKGNFGKELQYKGIYNYEVLARMGDIKAQIALAEIYEKPLYGFEANRKTAYKWYQKAARQGDAKALKYVASYTHKVGSSKRKEIKKKKLKKAKEQRIKAKKVAHEKAKAKRKKVANTKQSLKAQAKRYIKSRYFTKALKIYKSLAKKGDKESRRKVNSFYSNGWHIKRKTLEKMYTKEAERGSSRAQFALGKFYYSAHGKKPDFKRAKYWVEKAALQNRIKAEEFLSDMYRDGIGTDKSEVKAKFWKGRAKMHKKR